MGEAVATGAGRLHARWVVHTVGPVWPGPGAEADARRELLRGAYRNSLGLAARLGAASVALPAVSAGVYGWPADDAAAVALATASGAAPDAAPDRVRFVLFSARMHEEFRAAAERLGLAIRLSSPAQVPGAVTASHSSSSLGWSVMMPSTPSALTSSHRSWEFSV